MMGGRRVIRLRLTGESAPTPVKEVVTAVDAGHLATDALLVVEGGGLSKRSALRKLFESAAKSVAAPCYEDSPGDVRALINQSLKGAGASIAEEALELLASSLGEDRALTRRELEKLSLYAEGLGREITPEDVRLVVADAGGAELDTVVRFAIEGQVPALEDEMAKARAVNTSPISLLRALTRHVDRLHTVQAAAASGISSGEAIKRLRPPVFYAHADAFRRHLQIWSEPRLRGLLVALQQTEEAAKTTGSPQAALTEKMFFDVARAARGRQARAS